MVSHVMESFLSPVSLYLFHYLIYGWSSRYLLVDDARIFNSVLNKEKRSIPITISLAMPTIWHIPPIWLSGSRFKIALSYEYPNESSNLFICEFDLRIITSYYQQEWFSWFGARRILLLKYEMRLIWLFSNPLSRHCHSNSMFLPLRLCKYHSSSFYCACYLNRIILLLVQFIHPSYLVYVWPSHRNYLITTDYLWPCQYDSLGCSAILLSLSLLIFQIAWEQLALYLHTLSRFIAYNSMRELRIIMKNTGNNFNQRINPFIL